MKNRIKPLVLIMAGLFFFTDCNLASDGPDIIAAGFCNNGSYDVAGYWQGGKWTRLDNPNGNYPSTARSLVVDGEDVYAGGFCNNGTVCIAGFWKNGSWIPLANSYGATNDAFVRSIAVYNDTVYAAGYCNDGANIRAGYWTVTASAVTWTALSDALCNTAFVMAAAVDSVGNVYAGGYYFSGTNCIACCWKNNAAGRTDLANTYDSGYYGMVYSIAVDGTDVYAGGGCVIDTSSNSVAGYWKITSGSTTWTELTNTYGGPFAEVDAIVVSDGVVYGGGYSSNASPLTIAGYWTDGTAQQWKQCTNKYGSNTASINSLFLDGNDVYAGGYSGNGSHDISGFWKNGSWAELENPYGDYSSSVSSIVINK